MGGQTAGNEKHICTGLFAHVDAGKTTLSEAMLYQSGALRRLGPGGPPGRLLDTDHMERERDITIFSKQAELSLPWGTMTLPGYPRPCGLLYRGRADATGAGLRNLVISGTDGVQAHTRTLWRLLERYGVPVFIFVNKMDLAGAKRGALLADLKRSLDDACVDLTTPHWAEEAAVCDEAVLERYLETGEVSDRDVAALVAERKLFLCFFGSALKVEGVDAFLEGLSRFASAPGIRRNSERGFSRSPGTPRGIVSPTSRSQAVRFG